MNYKLVIITLTRIGGGRSFQSLDAAYLNMQPRATDRDVYLTEKYI